MQIRNTALCLVAILLMPGCATQAQRQAADIQSRGRETAAQATACSSEVTGRPEFAPIAARLTRSPTLAQLTDQTLASPSEATTIGEFQAASLPCRAIRQTYAESLTPRHSDTMRRGYAAIDQIYADLMLRRISWGEASSRYRDATNLLIAEMNQAGVAMNERLDQQHNAEMRQRAAAASAIAAGLQAQQAAMQRQQIINNMNRPVMTNCTRIGSSVSCSSF